MMEEGQALAVLVADILNKALEKEPSVVGELIDLRIPAPKMLSEHPNVQVFKNHEGIRQVSILGLLNGFFKGWAVAYHHTGEFRVLRLKSKK